MVHNLNLDKTCIIYFSTKEVFLFKGIFRIRVMFQRVIIKSNKLYKKKSRWMGFRMEMKMNI